MILEQSVIVSTEAIEIDPQIISIGRTRTYGTVQICFDCAAVIEKYGSVEGVELWLMMPGKPIRTRMIEFDGVSAFWLVDETDTDKCGNGEAELYFYLSGGGLWKSSIFPVIIKPDINKRF